MDDRGVGGTTTCRPRYTMPSTMDSLSCTDQWGVKQTGRDAFDEGQLVVIICTSCCMDGSVLVACCIALAVANVRWMLG